MDILRDPIFLRFMERILTVLGGIIFAFLGYRLFIFGVTKGKEHLSAESKLFRVVLSGTGPGLFFMAFGAIILVTSLLRQVTFNRSVTEDSPVDSETSLHPMKVEEGSHPRKTTEESLNGAPHPKSTVSEHEWIIMKPPFERKTTEESLNGAPHPKSTVSEHEGASSNHWDEFLLEGSKR